MFRFKNKGVTFLECLFVMLVIVILGGSIFFLATESVKHPITNISFPVSSGTIETTATSGYFNSSSDNNTSSVSSRTDDSGSWGVNFGSSISSSDSGGWGSYSSYSSDSGSWGDSSYSSDGGSWDSDSSSSSDSGGW